MKIVAIGGGEIGRPGYPVQTTKIDKEIIRLSGKKHPKLLFIPTASWDAEEYIQTVGRHFGRRLGCSVDSLCVAGGSPSMRTIRAKISNADIIYVGGGDTQFMMRRWRRLGIDKLLYTAGKRGAVLSGLSAGAVCWARYAFSDSRKMKNPDADYIRVSCLGFLPFLICPHFDTEATRAPSLKRYLKRNGEAALALDDCAALVLDGTQARIMTSKPHARAYRCFWRNGVYETTPLTHLTKKPILVDSI